MGGGGGGGGFPPSIYQIEGIFKILGGGETMWNMNTLLTAHKHLYLFLLTLLLLCNLEKFIMLMNLIILLIA